MRKANYMQTGVIFNIQKFSINDGPGIRTVVFFKGCPLHCKWCANPESQLAKIQILWDKKKCLHCHHCLEICPVKAISLKDDNIFIDTNKCTLCKQCINICPQKALTSEGKIKTVQQVLDIVLQDEVFYEESDGGITLSGGEFLMQTQFAEELLIAAKEKNLHTCCETTGFCTPEKFQHIIQYIDYILFDLKHWDSQKHLEGTGIDNKLILTNMKYAISMGKTVLPRIPIIPKFNDSLEDAKKFCEVLHAVGSNQCQLLPFHQFGENKYHLLNKKYAYENQPALHREDLQDYLQIFLDNDIHAFF
ncbi:glycyl-radical enzyme activating protein [uncultured Megamonas sp.]|uniref:glycyl-radical enzyme activating protein n=1 Tax=uncultured Megamonas sp. TaxID=286140 RepID=UPI00266E9692|nr:glycyl-radical enzyme activating protein [uncultured Megamonas sp.]